MSSNDNRPDRRGRAGQTRNAGPQSRTSNTGNGLDGTTLAFIVLVLVVIAGSVLLVMRNRSLADTGAIQEVSDAVAIDGDALPRFDGETMTPATDPAIGATAPQVTSQDFQGNDVDLLDGETAKLLVFLSHSCRFCQAELPVLLEDWVYGDLPDGVEPVAIPTNTNPQFSNYPPSDWLLATDEPWTSPIVLDSASSEIGAAYGLSAYPFFVVVGADGTVRARVSGQLGSEGLQQLAEVAAGAADAGDVEQGEGGTNEGEDGSTASPTPAG